MLSQIKREGHRDSFVQPREYMCQGREPLVKIVAFSFLICPSTLKFCFLENFLYLCCGPQFFSTSCLLIYIQFIWGKGQWKAVVSFFIGMYVHTATIHVHSLKTKVFRIVFNASGWLKIFFCPGGKDTKDNDLSIIAKRKGHRTMAPNLTSCLHLPYLPPSVVLYSLLLEGCSPSIHHQAWLFREGVSYL